MSSSATAPRALLVSEAAFLKQTEAIQKAFDTFKGIIAVPNISYSMINPILANLVEATVCFSLLKHISLIIFNFLTYRMVLTVFIPLFTILFSKDFPVKFKTLWTNFVPKTQNLSSLAICTRLQVW